MTVIARISVLAVIVSGLGACVGEASTDALRGEPIVVDHRDAVGSASAALSLDDPCPIVGMRVCTAEYENTMYRCGYSICEEWGYSWDLAHECGEAYRASARNDCGAVQTERDLWCSGRVDPTSIPECYRPGGGCCGDRNAGSASGGGGGGGWGDFGGGDSGGGGGGGRGSCTWCDCQGSWSEYHGDVCGNSGSELVDACWDSCI